MIRLGLQGIEILYNGENTLQSLLDGVESVVEVKKYPGCKIFHIDFLKKRAKQGIKPKRRGFIPWKIPLRKIPLRKIQLRKLPLGWEILRN